MAERKIYGVARIADWLGVSERTLRRWKNRPEGTFLEVGSMSNEGGGPGQAVWTFANSADALKEAMSVRTKEERRRAALARWNRVDVNSSQAF